MNKIKDTQRAVVRYGFDGHIHKTFSGPMSQIRFENEVRVLKYLEDRGCGFVPKLLEANALNLEMVTTNCGAEVENISSPRLVELFESLEREFGVLHGDAFSRNVTYNHRTGKFNVIDFEYSTIIETGEGFTISDEEAERRFGGRN